MVDVIIIVIFDSGMASCIVFGDPHYRTFDGRYHDFQGTCTYTFAKDCQGGNFEVIVQNNGKETYSVSWTQLMSFRLFNWTIDLLQNMKVKVDGVLVELPYLHEPDFSIQKMGELNLPLHLKFSKLPIKQHSK